MKAEKFKPQRQKRAMSPILRFLSLLFVAGLSVYVVFLRPLILNSQSANEITAAGKILRQAGTAIIFQYGEKPLDEAALKLKLASTTIESCRFSIEGVECRLVLNRHALDPGKKDYALPVVGIGEANGPAWFDDVHQLKFFAGRTWVRDGSNAEKIIRE